MNLDEGNNVEEYHYDMILNDSKCTVLFFFIKFYMYLVIYETSSHKLKKNYFDNIFIYFRLLVKDKKISFIVLVWISSMLVYFVDTYFVSFNSSHTTRYLTYMCGRIGVEMLFMQNYLEVFKCRCWCQCGQNYNLYTLNSWPMSLFFVSQTC